MAAGRNSFDEMSGMDGDAVRAPYAALDRWLKAAPPELLQSRSRQAELFFRRMGITFAVYGDAESSERLIPFDVVPRIIGASEWAGLEAGLIGVFLRPRLHGFAPPLVQGRPAARGAQHRRHATRLESVDRLL